MGSGSSKSCAKSGEKPNGSARDPEDSKVLCVITKLKKLYPEKNEDEVIELAKVLADPEEIEKKYFHHIVKKLKDRRTDAKEDATLAKEEWFGNKRERDYAKERLAASMKYAKNIEVKLLWLELEQNMLIKTLANNICPLLRGAAFAYGPFHVALQVDDVRIEWDDSSVIIPHQTNPQSIIFAAKVGEPQELPRSLEDSLSNTGIASIANEVSCTAENKLLLIQQLCVVIASFNTKKEYALFSSNCQHFAMEVLRYLQVDKEEIPQIFEERSKALAAIVIACSKNPKLVEFNSHRELHRYVIENSETLSTESLEFCRLHYLLFHAMGAKCPNKDAWRCKQDECRLSLIEDRLRTCVGGNQL